MHLLLKVEGSPEGHPRTTEFRYLWARHVFGINPAHHCALCLRGPYEKLIRRGLIDGVYEIEAKHPFFYICGVTSKWASNLHMVVRPQLGAEAIVDTFNGIRLSIMNGERVPITPLPDGWNRLPKAFTTCRNFQFAVEQFGYEPAQKDLLGVID